MSVRRSYVYYDQLGKAATAREAVILAALCGNAGDDPQPFAVNVPRAAILDWAASHLGRSEGLEAAFDALLAEGLFFEVFPGEWDPPRYACSYDPRFLTEIPGAAGAWDGWAARYDRHPGPEWRTRGLHAGDDTLCSGPGCFRCEEGV